MSLCLFIMPSEVHLLAFHCFQIDSWHIKLILLPNLHWLHLNFLCEPIEWTQAAAEKIQEAEDSSDEAKKEAARFGEEAAESQKHAEHYNEEAARLRQHVASLEGRLSMQEELEVITNLFFSHAESSKILSASLVYRVGLSHEIPSERLLLIFQFRLPMGLANSRAIIDLKNFLLVKSNLVA